jgi:site-specific recombinase XerC
MSASASPHPRDTASPGRIPGMDPLRRQDWAGKTPQQVLARYRPGRAPPLEVLDVLLTLFNSRHTAREKTVSHKTRHERAGFLRRFFRDLSDKAGFRTPPDPRNLGQKHVHAMVQVWQREHLAPATIQTYLSFLRGLASWLGKPGFVRPPAYYGLTVADYERHEVAQRDRSWQAQGLDADAVIAQVAAYDQRVAASMRLMQALGLRGKESVTFRPFEDVRPFEQTGLPPDQRKADHYVWVKGKGGRVRWIELATDAQRAAVAQAQSVVTSRDAHLGDPARTLAQNLRRLLYVLEKFGITRRASGATGHGLRHGHCNDLYEEVAAAPSPVRGGGVVRPDVDLAARQAVSIRAGHARLRAAGAYVGSLRSRPSPPLPQRPIAPPPAPDA